MAKIHDWWQRLRDKRRVQHRDAEYKKRKRQRVALDLEQLENVPLPEMIAILAV